MKIFSKSLNSKKMSANIWFFCVMFFIIIIAYFVNSFYVKTHIMVIDSCWEYFMINYFNDFWAGVFIVSLTNLLSILGKKKYVKHIVFYITLWIIESFVWELVRPYILIIINPFDKSPTALWGDVVVYGAGTFGMYALLLIFNFALEKVDKRNERA